jgi:hypothetical protein
MVSSIRFDRDRRGLHADGPSDDLEVAASLATETKRRSACPQALAVMSRRLARHGRMKTARRASRDKEI